MTTNPAYNLLLQSVRLDDPNAAADEAQRIISSGTLDWVDLMVRAEAYSIKPQLGMLLSRMPDGFVPATITDKLKEANGEILYSHLNKVAEFFRVKEKLEEAGVLAVPFKGFWIAHEMYGNLADRESGDIDLFIDVHDIEKVKSVMADLGYIVQETLTKLTDEYIYSELAEYNFDLYSGEIPVSHFEFHWRMGLASYRMNIGMETLKTQVVAATLQGRELKVFTPSANLLLAVMHHGAKDCYIQLKQVLDIAMIIKRYPDLDWDWLFHEAERFHVKNLVYLGIRLASELTGAAVPAPLTEKVNSKRIARLARHRIRRMNTVRSRRLTYTDDLRGWLFKIRSRDGLATKMHLTYYTVRKIILPHLVPQKLRYLFFNKKIRANNFVNEGV